MLKKRKEEKAQKKAQGHGKEAKMSMISLKGVKKVMFAQKPIFLAYSSESSPSFQSPHPKCPQDLSLVLDDFQDVFQEPRKGLPPLRGIKHQIDSVFIPICSVLRFVPLALRSHLASSVRRPYTSSQSSSFN